MRAALKFLGLPLLALVGTAMIASEPTTKKHVPIFQVAPTQLSLRGHVNLVTHMVVSPNGQLLAAADAAGLMNVWNTEKGAFASIIVDNIGGARDLTFSPDSAYLVNSDDSEFVKFWNPQRGVLVFTVAPTTTTKTFNIQCLAISPDQRYLAIGENHKNPLTPKTPRKAVVRIYDLIRRQDLKPVELPLADVQYLAFQPQRSALFAAYRRYDDEDRLLGGLAMLSEVPSWREISSFDTPGSYEPRLWKLSGDGKHLAVVNNQSRAVEIWQVESGERAQRHRLEKGILTCIALNDDGRVLAGAGTNKAVWLWDTETGKLLQTLDPMIGGTNSLTFSADQTRLYGLSGRTLNVWSVISK